ncbi:hypothetical protein DFH29DRAFT_1018933 [Suillus ampliporus]|nr:hypothetical protein DFH29DRAFT_1018933 [Suillus ampliporus]
MAAYLRAQNQTKPGPQVHQPVGVGGEGTPSLRPHPRQRFNTSPDLEVVQWFDTVGDSPDFGRHRDADGSRSLTMSTITPSLQSTALLTLFPSSGIYVSPNLQHHQTYDSFRKSYVNKYADRHRAFEIAC